MQQLQHLIEACRVTGTRCADREQARHVSRDVIACEHGFPRGHPVPIALNRVYLSVMRYQAIRVR